MTDITAATDTMLAIASVRAVRKYKQEPLPEAVLRRILQAGRATGSASNRQPWMFVVVRNRSTLDELAEHVWEPDNLSGCPLAIAIVQEKRRPLDAGRAIQNLVLAAWVQGVGSCPNTFRDLEPARELLQIDEDARVPMILSMGYPKRPLKPRDNDVDTIMSRIKRKPLEEITRFID